MKKNIIAMLFCVMSAVVDMSAQTKDTLNSEVILEGGIKADVTFLNFQKAGAPGAVSTFTPGFALGGFLDVWFNKWLGLQPEVNLNFKQTVMSWDENSGRMQSFGIEVPIYVMFRSEVFKRHHVFFGLGPYTEFSCFARWLIGDRDVNLLNIHKGKEPMIQDTQSGFGTILGYEFGNGLILNVSYKLCCFNILQPNTSQGVSLYPQSASIGLAYKF